MPWKADWMPLPPEPKGDDEDQARAMYIKACDDSGVVGEHWDKLPEWKRESWRRELRALEPEEE